MQRIVDCRLGDVYHPRLSSHLIYAGSRHNPGMRSSLRLRGQQEGRALLLLVILRNDEQPLGRESDVDDFL
jgi:hypothetical protein